MLKILIKKRREITFYLFLVLFFITLKTLEKTVDISTPVIYNNFALKLDADSIAAGVNKYDDDTKSRAELINRPSIPKTIANCTTSRTAKPKIETRGNFTIVTNFVIAKRQVNCRQFVTYTTHGDFRYLDNLVPLVERWMAPVSVALYTPTSELQPTLNRIAYIRECTTPLIKRWVTFHLFAETMDFTDPTPFLTHLQESSKELGICEDTLKFTGSLKLVGRKGNRVYPINVARNVARLAATTHFVFASDIELFPSLDFNTQFVDLLIREESMFKSRQVPYVFVLPVFEINNHTKLPDTKKQLAKLINEGLATTFHVKICQSCHRMPKYKEWVSHKGNASLNVFHVAKRKTPIWEPIFVGTNQDPLYDERLSWEGLQDKMSQAYALCLLDYDFMILDSAFLVHRNGIQHSLKKTFQPHPHKWKHLNSRVGKQLKYELQRLYGNRTDCNYHYRRRNRTITITMTHSKNEKMVNLTKLSKKPSKGRRSRTKSLKKQSNKSKSNLK